jgi:hypothetical protein
MGPDRFEHATRRRISIRLLPFVFLLYVISYVDRVNVSFANLRMSADLRFSDRIFGLGPEFSLWVTFCLRFQARSLSNVGVHANGWPAS